MKVLTSLLLTIGIQAFGHQKDTILITAGSKELQTQLLTSYNSSYEFFTMKDGVETLIGGLDDSFQVFSTRKQALRVCKIKFGPNSILDSGLCELRGLAPVYHRSVQTKKNMNLSFNKDKVAGKIIFKDTENKIETVDYKTPAPLFDSFYEDIIAKTIDLNIKSFFRFPEYIYEKGGTVWSVGEVLKGESPSERIIKFYEINAKKEVVRTTTFVINESSREILRREYLMGANKIIMKKKA